MIRRPARLFFIASLLLFIITQFQIRQLPNSDQIVPELKIDPIQTETEQEPFVDTINKIEYTIEPLAEYELTGLIVSQLTSGTFLDYFHDDWEDFVNIKDICVIWGDNLSTGIYDEMKFKTKSWSCEYWYPNWEVGSKFRANQFSNNHLLTSSTWINQEIKKAKRGDQIRLEGYLVRYSHSDGQFRRGSSLTREDAGNGACETIWVTNFEILAQNKPTWRLMGEITLWTMGISFLSLLFLKKRSA